MKPVRIFVVDDSASARALLRHYLHGFEGIELVGEARSGPEALVRVPASGADVVLIDVVMPGMDGLSVTRELMGRSARPVLIMSHLATQDAELGFRALEAGALEMMPKPTAQELQDPAARRTLARKLRVLAGVPVVTRRLRSMEGTLRPLRASDPPAQPTQHAELVCIGASTGGPPALLLILRALGKTKPSCPLVIVQHMAAGFIAGMAQWLADETGLTIRIAADGELLSPGTVYLAPDDRDLRLRGSRLVLSACSAHESYCPSVDVMFESVAHSGSAPGTLGVLLTGMGSDGARGLLRLREAGAWTLAQDEATSTVFGMPRAAVELQAACEVLSLGSIASRVAMACSERRH